MQRSIWMAVPLALAIGVTGCASNGTQTGQQQGDHGKTFGGAGIGAAVAGLGLAAASPLRAQEPIRIGTFLSVTGAGAGHVETRCGFYQRPGRASRPPALAH